MIAITVGLYYAVIMALFPDIMNDPTQPTPISPGLFSSDPVLAIVLFVVYLNYLGAMALMGFAYAGIQAKAALTDPIWQGDRSPADTFS